VLGVVADLAGLQSLEARVDWEEVQHVVEERASSGSACAAPAVPFPQGRSPQRGALDALAGMRFRLLFLPRASSKCGFPGVLRPDPLLLDKERGRLAALLAAPPSPPGAANARRRWPVASCRCSTRPAGACRARKRAAHAACRPRKTGCWSSGACSTGVSRLLEATEKLVLLVSAADARRGASGCRRCFLRRGSAGDGGASLGTAELARATPEDDLRELPLEHALDRGARDLVRVAARWPRSGAADRRRLALLSASRTSRARPAGRRTSHPYDGSLSAASEKTAPYADAARGSARRCSTPIGAKGTVSASRLARYASCVASSTTSRTCCALEPNARARGSRKRLEPLGARASLVPRDVAERFTCASSARCDQRPLLPRSMSSEALSRKSP
jgi:hypothetical protein